MNKILTVVIGLISLASFSLATADAASTTGGKKGLLPLGSPAPDFALPDVTTGKDVKLSDFSGKKALVVIFLCRHCPFVQRVKGGIAALGRDYMDKDVAIVAISSNDPEAYAEDSPERLKEMASQEGFSFPLLFDGDRQTAGRAYTAVATPDVFVFDAGRKLVYRGQFDSARPGNEIPVTGEDVRAAIEAVLAGQAVSTKQKPAIGCSIKWKKGNEPDYY